jgi:hypothetical protein
LQRRVCKYGDDSGINHVTLIITDSKKNENIIKIYYLWFFPTANINLIYFQAPEQQAPRRLPPVG